MISQQDHSQVAQENIVVNGQQNARKYISYHDIKKYESQYVDVNTSNHQCRPVYIEWNRQKPNQFLGLAFRKVNASEWIIDKQLNQCCLNFKICLNIGLIKRTYIEIFKIRKININNNTLFEQQGLKYRIQHALSSIKIQTFITKQHVTKIWKQIQIPIKSHEVEVQKTINITQKINGDIIVMVDQFEFMLNAMIPKLYGLYFVIKGEIIIHKVIFQESKDGVKDNGSGCTQQRCVIF